MTASKDDVLRQLRRVKGPDLEGNIVDLGLVDDLLIREDEVIFSIRVPAQLAPQLEALRGAAEKAALSAPGVKRAVVVLTAVRNEPHERRTGPRPEAKGEGALPPPMAAQVSGQSAAAPQPDAKAPVPGIGAIVAVASGKGGVGKSTTSVNVALALQENGLRVGILDADVYGPSMPRLLKISGRPQMGDDKTMTPLEGYGLKVMSMGFIVEEDTPMIWRGAMVMQTLTQMLRNVAWGELDVLVIDMPPGTGDAQLTIAQNAPLAGAVIVSTPQDLALIDARKGLTMFRKVDVPILGIVENMSVFVCPHCGERHDLFGHGGARKEAERIGVPFLGEVPLEMAIREKSDGGTPIVVADPGGTAARIYRDIAAAVWTRVGEERMLAGIG